MSGSNASQHRLFPSRLVTVSTLQYPSLATRFRNPLNFYPSHFFPGENPRGSILIWRYTRHTGVNNIISIYNNIHLHLYIYIYIIEREFLFFSFFFWNTDSLVYATSCQTRIASRPFEGKISPRIITRTYWRTRTPLLPKKKKRVSTLVAKKGKHRCI